MTKLKNYGIFTGNTLNTAFGYDEENVNCIKLKALLSNLFSQNTGVYYSDCQAGLGIISAEEVLKSKNQLFGVIPYENQAKKWTSDFRERYFSLHEKSVDTKLISKKYHENCHINTQNYIATTCDEAFVILSSNDKMPTGAKIVFDLGKKVTLINCDDFTIKIAQQEDF